MHPTGGKNVVRGNAAKTRIGVIWSVSNPIKSRGAKTRGVEKKTVRMCGIAAIFSLSL